MTGQDDLAYKRMTKVERDALYHLYEKIRKER